MTFTIWLLGTAETPMIQVLPGAKLKGALLRDVPTTENGGITNNGKTYTVHFREGIKWSDGQPITGRDLVFTWKTIMNPQMGASSQLGWEQIKNIQLSNNNLTATIQVKDVYAPFLAYVLTSWLLPEHHLKGMPVQQIAKSTYSQPGKGGAMEHVGSGPFVIQSWAKGDNITAVRNDNYFGDKACLDKMVFSFLKDTDQQTSALQRGDIDLATNYTEGDLPTLQQLEGEGIQVLSVASPGSVERYYFNLHDPKDPMINKDPKKARPHPIFSDKNVRMAIAMGINRPAIVEKVLYGQAKVAVTELSGQEPWENEKLQPYPFDPNKAAQMLDQAGWKVGSDGIRAKNGQRLSFTHTTTTPNPIRETIQRLVQSDLRKMGVEMNIKNADPNKLFATYAEGGIGSRRQFDMVGWTTGTGVLDPDITWEFHTSQIPRQSYQSGSNVMGYSKPQVDKLLDQNVRQPDPQQRKQTLDQVQQQVYDDVPVIYMYVRLRIDAAGPNLKGLTADPMAGLWWNPQDWYLENAR